MISISDDEEIGREITPQKIAKTRVVVLKALKSLKGGARRGPGSLSAIKMSSEIKTKHNEETLD